MCHKHQTFFIGFFLTVLTVLGWGPAFAVSAGAPSISGSNFSVSGTVINSETRGVQGGGSGASYSGPRFSDNGLTGV